MDAWKTTYFPFGLSKFFSGELLNFQGGGFHNCWCSVAVSTLDVLFLPLPGEKWRVFRECSPKIRNSGGLRVRKGVGATHFFLATGILIFGRKTNKWVFWWVRDFPPPPKNTPRKIVIYRCEGRKQWWYEQRNNENLPKGFCGPIPFTPKRRYQFP